MGLYHYVGIRPHIQRAGAVAGVNVGRVERTKQIKDLNNMLCQAVTLAKSGNIKAVAGALEVARRHIAELAAAMSAARSAYDEVAKGIGVDPTPLATDAESIDSEAASKAKRKR